MENTEEEETTNEEETSENELEETTEEVDDESDYSDSDFTATDGIVLGACGLGFVLIVLVIAHAIRKTFTNLHIKVGSVEVNLETTKNIATAKKTATKAKK